MNIRINIGADELILWLRKNGKAESIPNDEIQGLGIKIHELIVNKLGGEKTEDNKPSYWANLIGDKNVEKFGLPKTSVQYKIDTDRLGELYEELATW
jgi:hypothetical protein